MGCKDRLSKQSQKLSFTGLKPCKTEWPMSCWGEVQDNNIHIHCIAGELDISQIRCDQDALDESNRLQEVFDKYVAEMNEKQSNNWKVSYLNIC